MSESTNIADNCHAIWHKDNLDKIARELSPATKEKRRAEIIEKLERVKKILRLGECEDEEIHIYFYSLIKELE